MVTSSLVLCSTLIRGSLVVSRKINGSTSLRLLEGSYEIKIEKEGYVFITYLNLMISSRSKTFTKLFSSRILETIAREIRKKGIDLEKIEREIEEEADKIAAKKIEDVLVGH